MRVHPFPRLASVSRPKQARSERTLHRLLDAAEQLIAEKELADVSVPEIARRAGSSVGGFYARFRDKNELLRALEERFFGRERERVGRLTRPDVWGTASLGSIVRAYAAELVGVFRDQGPLIRAFVSRAVHDVEFRGEALRFRQQTAERLAAFLLARSDAMRHPDPRLACELGLQMAFATMVTRVVFGDVRAGGRVLADADLADELARNFLGYLGIDDSDHEETPA